MGKLAGNPEGGLPEEDALTPDDIAEMDAMEKRTSLEADQLDERLRGIDATDRFFDQQPESEPVISREELEARLHRVETFAAIPKMPDHTHPRLLDTSWFHAIIGANAQPDTTDRNRHNYAWQEAYQIKRADGTAVYTVLVDGRSGTTALNPARNTFEDGHPQVYKVSGSGRTDAGAVPSLESPNGLYFENGTYNSQPAYERTDGVFWIWWDSGSGAWELTAGTGDWDPGWHGNTTLLGAYPAATNVTGSPVVSIADMPAVPNGTPVRMHMETVDGKVQPVFSHGMFYGQVLGDGVWINSGGGHIQTTTDPADVAFTIGDTNTSTSTTVFRAITLDTCRHVLKILVGTEGCAGGTWYWE